MRPLNELKEERNVLFNKLRENEAEIFTVEYIQTLKRYGLCMGDKISYVQHGKQLKGVVCEATNHSSWVHVNPILSDGSIGKQEKNVFNEKSITKI